MKAKKHKTLCWVVLIILSFIQQDLLGKSTVYFDNLNKQVAVLVCHNSVEMYEHMSSIIACAQKRVDMALCFTGGECFQRLLKILEKRIKEKRELQVYILYDMIFLDEDDRAFIETLKEKFSSQLHFEVSDSAPMPFPQVHCYRSHLKMIVVDGKYFSLGGTNIEDLCCSEGSFTPDYQGNDARKYLLGLCERSLGNRDQDIVCRDSYLGNMLSERFHLYFAKWRRYTKTRVFTVDPLDNFKESNFIPISFEEAGTDFAFEQRSDLVVVPSSNINIFFGTPSSKFSENEIYQGYLEAINSATSSICVANLFFMPDPIFQQALVNAAKRGVRIEIITNGCGEGEASLNQLFAWGNRYYYLPMLYGRRFTLWQKETALCTPALSNVSIFEYAVPLVELHKKIMIIDQKTLVVGSYNIDYRSRCCDYEICAFIDSPAAAGMALRVFEQDKSLSRPVTAAQSCEWYFDPVVRAKGILQTKYK